MSFVDWTFLLVVVRVVLLFKVDFGESNVSLRGSYSDVRDVSCCDSA